MTSLCALCGAHPPSASGEHVLTRWLIRGLFPTGDRYSLEVNGETVEERSHVAHVKLDICNSTSGGVCNDVLSRRFERNFTRESVRAMFTPPASLSPDAAKVATEWWIKTALLKVHPRAYRGGRAVRLPVWTDDEESDLPAPVDPGLFSWCVNGGQPPAGLSLWVALRDRNGAPPSVGEPFEPGHIAHPMWRADDEGSYHRSRSSVFGIAQLQFHLLHHPGWEPEHPFEKTGRAIRLWPWAGGPLELGRLRPQDSAEETAWATLWQGDVRLDLAAGYRPLDSPWKLGASWSAEPPYAMAGVQGASYF